MVSVAQAYEMDRKEERAKKVELDGHGEATRIHELYLHELAYVGSTMVVP